MIGVEAAWVLDNTMARNGIERMTIDGDDSSRSLTKRITDAICSGAVPGPSEMARIAPMKIVPQNSGIAP